MGDVREKKGYNFKERTCLRGKKRKTNLSNSFPTSTSQIFYYYTNLFPSSILSLSKKKKNSSNKIQNLNYAFKSY